MKSESSSTSSSVSSHLQSSSHLDSYIKSSRLCQSANMDPASFSAEFNILYELSTNKEDYSSDEVQLTIYHFPLALLMLVDQTRARVPVSPFSSQPGRTITIVCCLSYGLSSIATHSDVRTILKMKTRLSHVLNESALSGNDKDTALAQGVFNIFEEFPVDVKDSSFSKSVRQGLHLSKNLKMALFGLKQSLGMSFDSLACLCMQISLYEQPWVLAEMRKKMENNINEFYRAVRIRRRIFEILTEEIEK